LLLQQFKRLTILKLANIIAEEVLAANFQGEYFGCADVQELTGGKLGQLKHSSS